MLCGCGTLCSQAVSQSSQLLLITSSQELPVTQLFLITSSSDLFIYSGLDLHWSSDHLVSCCFFWPFLNPYLIFWIHILSQLNPPERLFSVTIAFYQTHRNPESLTCCRGSSVYSKDHEFPEWHIKSFGLPHPFEVLHFPGRLHYFLAPLLPGVHVSIFSLEGLTCLSTHTPTTLLETWT